MERLPASLAQLTGFSSARILYPLLAQGVGDSGHCQGKARPME
jgi:hypothetical protein